MTAKTASHRSPRASRRTFGSVRKLPSGRFQARYKDDRGTDRTAPQTFSTKTAADEWLATERADLLRGTYRSPDLGSITLSEYFDTWLAQHTDLAPRTREMYVDRAQRWLMRDLVCARTASRTTRTTQLGSRALNTLTMGVIREWFAAAHHTQQSERAERRATAELNAVRQHPARVWARSQGMTVGASGRLSPIIKTAWVSAGSPMPVPASTAPDPHARPAVVLAQTYRLLHAVLATAVRDGLIAANPCQIRNAGNRASAERTHASPSEVQIIANAMPPRYVAAVHLAAWTGLRAGELFGLAREHLDMGDGTVRVERAMQELRGQKPYIGPTKTQSSIRTVHVPPHVVDLMTEHLEHYVDRDDASLLFAQEDGSLTPTTRRTAMFRLAREAAGRQDLRWHDLRHTGATLAAQTGASIREIQHRLGHSTYVAAMRYQHADPQRDHEIARRLSEIAAGPPRKLTSGTG